MERTKITEQIMNNINIVGFLCWGVAGKGGLGTWIRILSTGIYFPPPPLPSPPPPPTPPRTLLILNFYSKFIYFKLLLLFVETH